MVALCAILLSFGGKVPSKDFMEMGMGCNRQCIFKTSVEFLLERGIGHITELCGYIV